MSQNPLSGLRVPSAKELSDQIMGCFGGTVLDLSKPLARERLRKAIEIRIGQALDLGLEHALAQATEKAVRHVFALARDPNYQEQRAKRLKERRKRMIERAAEDKKKLEDARVERQRKAMQIVNKDRTVIQ